LPIPFVIDHMARVKTNLGLEQPAFQTLLDLMKDEKAWVKVSGPERLSVAGPPFTDAIPYARALIKAAPTRILWGTDFPHPNVKHMPNDGHLVDLLGMMAPDPATLKMIVVDNPTRLYWAN
jgi:2-pyrone-4,6-dicarboxylate lactonase